jgi:cytochrome c-type biogenesis protein CcmF
VVAGIVQELWRGVRARRATSREPVPLAFISLVRRNRRRYGGYFVHIGVITLFVGVAASSSFKNVQDVALSPGQTKQMGDYKITYEKPIAELHAASNGRLERISLGAQLAVSKNGGKPKPLRTSKDYFPSQDSTLGPVSRFFDGESTTEVGLDASLHNDVWAAVAPDIAKIRPRIDEGDRLFDKAANDLSAEQSNQFLALALKGLTDNYAKNPPPARFRFEINPMVSWIWIGGLIVLLGGIIAAWPSRRGMSRPVSARYAARVGTEVREPDRVPA